MSEKISLNYILIYSIKISIVNTLYFGARKTFGLKAFTIVLIIESDSKVALLDLISKGYSSFISSL